MPNNKKQARKQEKKTMGGIAKVIWFLLSVLDALARPLITYFNWEIWLFCAKIKKMMDATLKIFFAKVRS